MNEELGQSLALEDSPSAVHENPSLDYYGGIERSAFEEDEDENTPL